jgi:alpha-L-rhamnosidase
LILEDSPDQSIFLSISDTIERWNGAYCYTWRRQRIKYVKIDPKKLKGERIINKQWPGGLKLWVRLLMINYEVHELYEL